MDETLTVASPDLAELRENGDTLTLNDGRVLRLKIVPDEDASINDFDFYGNVYDGPPLRRNEMGYYSRPEGFTGNAERLRYGNDGPWWWEPPADVKRDDPAFLYLRDQVRELLAYGFNGIILELCEGTDAYGCLIVRNCASTWGVDGTEDIGDLVRDLADELGVSL